PSRAAVALGAERSGTAGVRDRQEVLGGHDRVVVGQQGEAAGLEDLSQPRRSARPAATGSRAEHGSAVPGPGRTVVAPAERATKATPEARGGENPQERHAGRTGGVPRTTQGAAD